MGSEVEFVAAVAGQGVAVATKCKTTPTPPSYGSVCLLCLRLKTCTSVKCDPEKHHQSRLACIKYVALVSRYLKLGTELSKFSEQSYWGGDKDFGSEKSDTTTPTVSGVGGEMISAPTSLLQNQKESDERNELAEEISKFVICDTCLPIANSFCESFQEYEYVRLKLHEKIYESTSLIKKSRSLDESIKVIRGIKRRLESEDCLTSFRTKLKIRGSEVIKDSIPRLRVTRNKNADALAAKLKSKKLLFIDGKPKYVSPLSKTKSKTPASTQEPPPIVAVITPSTSNASSTSGNSYQASNFSTAPSGTLYNSNSTVIVNDVPISFVTSTSTTSQVPQPHQTQAQEKLPIRFIHASAPATGTQNKTSHSNSKIPRNQNRKPTPVTLRKDAGGGFIVAITPAVDTNSRKRPAPVEPEPIFSSSVASSSHITVTDTSSTLTSQQRKNLQGSSVTYQTIQQTTKPTYSQSIVISSTTPTLPSNNVQVTSPPQIPSVLIQTCNINNCGTSFPLSEEGRFALQSHLATHRTLRCSICGADEFSPMELISHELEHETYDDNCISVTSFSGFKCPRCPYTSPVRSEYQEHFLEKHLNSKIKLLKCEECKKGFSYTKPKVYSNHILNCHPEGNESKSTCFKCNFCTAYFKKESMFWKHLKNDHRVNSKNGNFRCVNCPKAYYMQKFLQLHQDYDCSEPQSEATKKACPDSSCGAMFSTLKGLKKHIRDHGPDFKLPECPVCKVKFYENTTLKYHVITHNGEQVKLVFPEGSNIDPLIIPIETGISTPVQVPVLPVVSSTESSSFLVSSPIPTPTQPTTSSQMQPLNVETTTQTFLPSSTSAVQSQLVYPVIMSVSSFAPGYNNLYSTTSAWNQPSTHYSTCNSINGNSSEFGPPSAVVHSATETVQEQKFVAKDEVLDFDFDEANVSDESLQQLGLFDQLISNVGANGDDLIPTSWLVPDEFMMQ